MGRAASLEWVRINLVSVGRVGTAAVCLPPRKLVEKKPLVTGYVRCTWAQVSVSLLGFWAGPLMLEPDEKGTVNSEKEH